MPAGVTVTAVLDCCHSGSVLDLPYSYQPTPVGTIRMRQNFSSLSNLAFLYLLAGGALPHGFGNVSDNIQDVTGVDDLGDVQGVGMDGEDGLDYDRGDGGDNDAAQDEVNGTDDAAAGQSDVPDSDGDYGADDNVGYYNDDGCGGGGGGGGADSAFGDGGGYDNTWGGDTQGFGATGFAGRGEDMGDMGGGDGGEDIDCSCLGDVLQGLLEE